MTEGLQLFLTTNHSQWPREPNPVKPLGAILWKWWSSAKATSHGLCIAWQGIGRYLDHHRLHPEVAARAETLLGVRYVDHHRLHPIVAARADNLLGVRDCVLLHPFVFLLLDLLH